MEPHQVIELLALYAADGAIDLVNLESGTRDEEARRLVKEEATRPFDLVTGPLFRGTLIRIGEDDHVLILNMHHCGRWVVAAGTSAENSRRSMKLLRRIEPSPLEDLAVQYADYSVWQRDVLAGEMCWRNRSATGSSS